MSATVSSTGPILVSAGSVAIGPRLALELEQNLSQQAIKLGELLRVQRSSQCRLLCRLDPKGFSPEVVTLLGQLDDERTPVVRVGQPPDEARFLQPIESVRHRSAREPFLLRELPRRAAVGRTGHRQVPEHAPVAERQVVLAERLAHPPPDRPDDPLHALDGGLDAEVDALKLGRPLGHMAIDRVLLLLRRHARIVHRISLDVKVVYRYSLDLK